MQCDEARQLIDFSEHNADEGGLTVHLQQCNACRKYGEDHNRLLRLLASLPVEEPGPAFEDRMISAARRNLSSASRNLHMRWAMATAASMILTVFLTVQYYPAGIRNSMDAGTVVNILPQQVRMIDILLDSPKAMEGAQITVRLDNRVELVGYEGIRDLRWETDLKSGSNKLSLPVQLLTDDTGEITVTVEHGGSSKQLSVIVNAQSVKRGKKLTMI